MSGREIALKVRRPRLRRFFWHLRDGTLRRAGLSYLAIWRVTREVRR